MFLIHGNGKEILFKSTDFWGNSSLGSKLTSDKELAYRLLAKHSFPVAKTLSLSDLAFEQFDTSQLRDFTFPLIVKPVNEEHGNGVMMHILTMDELQEKLSTAFETYDNLLIQEEIVGDEIRFLVVKGQVLVAIHRIPATVTGDGQQSIQQLIDQENAENEHRGTGYQKPLSFIEVDDELLSYIDKQKLDLDSTPRDWQEVQLRGNSNLGTWWTIIDVTNDVSDELKEVCIKACEIFGLDICGVDVLTSDFTKSLAETDWVILELNDTPGLGGDRELTTVNTWKEMLKLLFF